VFEQYQILAWAGIPHKTIRKNILDNRTYFFDEFVAPKTITKLIHDIEV
jgi:hypothetical protein